MAQERTKRYVGSTTFGELTRKERREIQRAERSLLAEARKREADERVSAARAEKAAWRSKDYLPATGEPGPAGLWTPRPYKAIPHRASTGILGAAYPYLADPGFGAQGMMLGQNRLGGSAFVYDPFVLYKQGIISDPNIIAAGKVGSGKSTLMKALTWRGAVFGYRTYVPADVKGEWTLPIQRMGGQAFELGPGMLARINPLEIPIKRPAGMSDEVWRELSWKRRFLLLETITERLMDEGRTLRAQERTALQYALTQVLRNEDMKPTLGHVVKELWHPREDEGGRVPDGFSSMEELRADSREVGHALARLTQGAMAGVLDRPSHGVEFDQSAPGISIDVSRLEGNDLLDVVMACTSSWMESALRDGTDSQRFMVYDEGWRVFSRPSLLRRMQENWKVSRAWGISNVLVFHGFGDLNTAGDGGDASRTMARNLVNDSATVISFRQTGEAVDAAQDTLDLTDTTRGLLPKLRKGQSVWRIGERMSLVQVSRTAREAAMFDTDERMTGAAA